MPMSLSAWDFLSLRHRLAPATGGRTQQSIKNHPGEGCRLSRPAAGHGTHLKFSKFPHCMTPGPATSASIEKPAAKRTRRTRTLAAAEKQMDWLSTDARASKAARALLQAHPRSFLFPIRGKLWFPITSTNLQATVQPGSGHSIAWYSSTSPCDDFSWQSFLHALAGIIWRSFGIRAVNTHISLCHFGG